MFSGYQIYKTRNVDPIRDCNLFIDHLKGKTFKKISEENNISASQVRNRVYCFERKIRYLACRFDNKYKEVFYNKLYKDDSISDVYNPIIISLAEDYKKYISEALKNNTLYKPFKKDLIPIKVICHACGK